MSLQLNVEDFAPASNDDKAFLLVEYGTTDEIFYNPQHEYTKGLINSIPRCV